MSKRNRSTERKVREDRIAKAQAETQRIVATRICPLCGSPLRRNWSLTGWWQCAQFGTEQFREDPRKPQCSWQGFTS